MNFLAFVLINSYDDILSHIPEDAVRNRVHQARPVAQTRNELQTNSFTQAQNKPIRCHNSASRTSQSAAILRLCGSKTRVNLDLPHKWAGHVALMGERRGLSRVLVGKPEGKRPLGRPRRRWEDNNKMDLQEVRCGSIDWTELAQDRDRWRALVTAVMNLKVQ